MTEKSKLEALQGPFERALTDKSKVEALQGLFERALTPAPTPQITLDLRKIGEPWFVDEHDQAWLMYDEIVIGHNSALNQTAVHFMHKGSHVHTSGIAGFPGFVDPGGIIHLTDVVGRLKVGEAKLVPHPA